MPSTDIAAAEALYQGCLRVLSIFENDPDTARDNWIRSKDFGGLAAVFAAPEARTRLETGAIAWRSFKDSALAKQYWQSVDRLLDSIEAGMAVREKLSPAELSDSSSADITASSFISLQHCLLLAGNRKDLERVRSYYDLPYVRLNDWGCKNPSPISAEARIQFAAWEGDLDMVDFLTPSMEAHYKGFKLPMVYTQLWRAVAGRDSAKLDSLLPEAETAYTKSARRKSWDFWGGGGKARNEAMIDVYSTCVLKIARDVGLTWEYGNDHTGQIWPLALLETWTV